MGGKDCHCAGNAGGMGFRDEVDVVSVVVHGREKVPAIKEMQRPCCLSKWDLVD